jgi:hypothetical protein
VRCSNYCHKLPFCNPVLLRRNAVLFFGRQMSHWQKQDADSNDGLVKNFITHG